MINELIKEYHDPPVMGHLGVLKVYRKMKPRFHFHFHTCMRERIEDFVRACIVCQMRNPRPEG